MSLRSTLRGNPLVHIAIFAVCILILIFSWRRSMPQAAEVPDAYYSDDDGATYFGDIANRIPPFDHQGKAAVSADVYRRTDGTAFVGYLERYTDTAAALVTRVRTPGQRTPLTLDEQFAILDGKQFKKPGEKEWKQEPRLMPGAKFAPRTATAPDGAVGTLVTPEQQQ